MPTLDEVLEGLEGKTVSADELQKIREAAEPKNFRQQLEEAGQWKPRAEKAEGDVEKLRAIPKVRKAFTDQGADIEKTPEGVLEQMLGFQDYEDKDKVSDFIKRFGVPVKQANDPATVPVPTPAAGVVDASMQPGTVPDAGKRESALPQAQQAGTMEEQVALLKAGGFSIVNE